MKQLLILLAIACAACAPSGQTSPGSPTEPSHNEPTPTPAPTPWPTPYPKHQDIQTFALLHIWYSAIPETYPKDGEWPAFWLRWVWPPHPDDPYKTIPGAPWLREISSEAYPLTGPYDSRNEQILRWQFRQAKAAGLTGFFVPVYSWDANLGYLDDLFFNVVLRLAHEMDLKVAIEGWGFVNESDAPRKARPWKDAIARHLAAIETSPYKDAYIQIDGKPAYWIIYPGWMSSKRELLEFFDGTDAQSREVSWLLRAVPKNTVFNINAYLRNSRLQYVSWYDDPTTEGFRFNEEFAGDIVKIRTEFADKGMVPIAHAYTGYDERAGVPDGSAGRRWGERSIIPTFLNDSKRAGARIILMESFNEWGEGSFLEAGLNIEQWRDMGQERGLFRNEQGVDAPYKYLDILRKFNGMQEWVTPEPPPCSAIDSLMLSHQEDLAEVLRCIATAAQQEHGPRAER